MESACVAREGVVGSAGGQQTGLDITVLMGGPSTEREVSLVSGAAIADALERGGHKVAVSPIWRVGAWSVHAFNVISLLSLVVWVLLATQRLRRLDVPQRLIATGAYGERTLWLTALGAGAGAILVRAVPTLRNFVISGRLVWAQGSSFTGVLLGGMVVGALSCRLYGLPLGRFFDLMGLPIPLSQAIGRLGCFAAGCCYGRVTGSWLGLYLPDTRGEWAVRYPTQLMSAAVDLLIFLGLATLERYAQRRERAGARPTRLFDGSLFLLYLDLYCLKRLLMEFLRGDATLLYGALSWVHIFSVCGMVTTTALIAWNLRHQRQNRLRPHLTFPTRFPNA